MGLSVNPVKLFYRATQQFSWVRSKSSPDVASRVLVVERHPISLNDFAFMVSLATNPAMSISSPPDVPLKFPGPFRETPMHRLVLMRILLNPPPFGLQRNR